jgi:hypothetical protein
MMPMLTYFGAKFDPEELVKHDKHFRLQSKFLREKPKGSDISRKSV